MSTNLYLKGFVLLFENCKWNCLFGLWGQNTETNQLNTLGMNREKLMLFWQRSSPSFLSLCVCDWTA